MFEWTLPKPVVIMNREAPYEVRMKFIATMTNHWFKELSKE